MRNTAAEVALGPRLRWALAVALAAACATARANPPAAQGPVDVRLLEFLGSDDRAAQSAGSDGGSWMAYLAQMKLGKQAAKTAAGSAPATATKAATPAKPDGGGAS